MTKQEEIREGIARIGVGGINPLENAIPNKHGYEVADDIISFLHSQSVVIKVDRELPKFPPDSELHSYGQAYVKGGRSYVQSLIEAGYVAVEPLIEGVKHEMF